MNKTFIKAHAALAAIGAPVTYKPEWFVMSAEDNAERLWANVDADYIDPQVEAILKAHGLDYCWNDAGTVYFHNA